VVRRTFDEDAWPDRAFAGEAERAQLDARERAFAQHLTYGTVQRARTLDHVIAVAGKRPLRKIQTPILHALRVGMFELMYGDRSAQHAAVDQAVELVRAATGERAVAFANAVLRRGQVDHADLLAALDERDDEDAATLLSFPVWMVRALRAQLGADGLDALRAQNEPRPGTPVRLNTLVETAADAEQALHDAGVEFEPVVGELASALPDARVVVGATAGMSGLVDRGVVQPQSLSSMLAVRALDPRPGERVVDLCAAPGGKTMYAAALMQGEGHLTAVELHEHRAASVKLLAARAGCAGMVHVVSADATEIGPDDIGGLADRVLVDAPCSGLGVLDARPDARWRHPEAELDQLRELQRRLLERAAALVRPGGVVVYCTCTLPRDENEDVVRHVVERGLLEPQPLDTALVPAGMAADEPHLARVWPHRHGSAGFFIACLRRPEQAP
jgi:16S rRNA (cytosine967-C5)-methyltransferase